MDYLLAAAFEHFGRGPGKRTYELIAEDDERVLYLRRRHKSR
jgi:hypothetical protein